MDKYKMNKAFKKTISLIITFIMILGGSPLDALSQLDTHLPDFRIITPTASASDGGSAGSNAAWSVDDNGVLTLSGTGKVTNIGWDSIRSDITGVIIEDGITSLPVNAFSDCVNLESV
ncbi:MAG: hypothetical protein K6B52_02225, partial [Clostridiales bacterium]|nr:hypothetical protein [Clostridiales bacterium]